MNAMLIPFPDLVAEANHRVANSLTLLGGLVRMQARVAGKATRSFTNAEIRLMLDGIAARVATVGELHRMLARVPGDGTVVLNVHLRDLAATLVAAFSSDQQQIHIEHSGSDCLVLTKHVQSLTLILCELLTNAMKYAHPAAGVPVRITLACENLSAGMLQLTVSDDGVGLPEGFDASKDGGLGFQIMRTLVAELGASLDIHSDSLGTTVRLRVPQSLVANKQTA
jgi:two-component sensor histidine kinase